MRPEDEQAEERVRARHPLVFLATDAVKLVPKRFQFLVYLAASAACCGAIAWFARNGWPVFPPALKGFMDLSKFQIYLFMAAPGLILLAIISFFWRNQPDPNDTQPSGEDKAQKHISNFP